MTKKKTSKPISRLITRDEQARKQQAEDEQARAKRDENDIPISDRPQPNLEPPIK